jgi:hypothetical protein
MEAPWLIGGLGGLRAISSARSYWLPLLIAHALADFAVRFWSISGPFVWTLDPAERAHQLQCHREARLSQLHPSHGLSILLAVKGPRLRPGAGLNSGQWNGHVKKKEVLLIIKAGPPLRNPPPSTLP